MNGRSFRVNSFWQYFAPRERRQAAGVRFSRTTTDRASEGPPLHSNSASSPLARPTDRRTATAPSPFTLYLLNLFCYSESATMAQIQIAHLEFTMSQYHLKSLFGAIIAFFVDV